jgi:hypothetical protein
MSISLVFLRKDSKSTFHTGTLWSTRHVHKANIRIVGGVRIDTLQIVWFLAVSVVVVRLTILDPAAHCRTNLAIIKVANLVWKTDDMVQSDLLICHFNGVSWVESR